MADLVLNLPPATRVYGERGELADHTLIVQAFQDILGYVIELRTDLDTVMDRSNEVVSASEPAHDGSQKANDLWIVK